LIGSQQVGMNQQTVDSVTLILPRSALLEVGTDVSLVEVPAMAGTPGFFVTVPTSQVLTLTDGFISVTIPRSSLPPGASLPTGALIPTGTLSEVFTATGPLLVQTVRSGAPQVAPNAPRSVPGLRLASTLSHGRFLAAAGR